MQFVYNIHKPHMLPLPMYKCDFIYSFLILLSRRLTYRLIRRRPAHLFTKGTGNFVMRCNVTFRWNFLLRVSTIFLKNPRNSATENIYNAHLRRPTPPLVTDWVLYRKYSERFAYTHTVTHTHTNARHTGRCWSKLFMTNAISSKS